MLAELKKALWLAEIALLVGLAIVLPLWEFPKNLIWFFYPLVWIANRFITGNFGDGWRLWDTLIILWVVSGYLSAIFAGLNHEEWRGAGDLAKYALVLWLVMRGRYSDRELRWVLGALVASTVVGLAAGYWRLWSGAARSGTLQLHSVGHVNHTAIYLAIMLGLCATWLFARWRAWRPGRRAGALAVTVLVLVSLVVTASRGALGVGLAALLVLGAAWWPRWRAPLLGSLLAVMTLIAASIVFDAQFIRKQRDNVASQNVMSFRDGVWRMGLAAWERYPWFGIGMDNYSLITHERLRAWRAAAGKDYDEARYVRNPHAHNLYVNTLAERGTLGFAALAAVLLAWLIVLVRDRPRPEDDDLEWLLWGASAAAWIATVGIGTVNTTLHHEHGILATLLLGLWLSRRQTRRAS